MKYHPLTELIKDASPVRHYSENEKMDAVIRSYLEDVAKEISPQDAGSVIVGHTRESINQILGLSPSKEVETLGITPGVDYPPKAPSGKVWCEHIKWIAGCWLLIYEKDTMMERRLFTDDWKQCPICGTPRPVEKSLAEKFREYIDKEGVKFLSPSTVFDLESIAEKHFSSARDRV